MKHYDPFCDCQECTRLEKGDSPDALAWLKLFMTLVAVILFVTLLGWV